MSNNRHDKTMRQVNLIGNISKKKRNLITPFPTARYHKQQIDNSNTKYNLIQIGSPKEDFLEFKIRNAKYQTNDT